jgi:uncharacterized membrane protein YhaH (DUF805 family)
MEVQMDWYLLAWKKFADFSGRSTRKEYWMFVLFHCLVFLALAIDSLSLLKAAALAVGVIYGLAALIPFLAVCVRRLHDSGKSGWLLLIELIPYIGIVILIVLMALDGDSGKNKYGPKPKIA